MTIQLSDLARSDLEDMRDFTIETWGRAQWLAYYREIANAFDRVARNPETGADRSLLVPGMRSVNCHRHVIFFQRLDAADGAPVVLRIVHGRRHLPALAYYDDLSENV